jgi:hypothetical protein
VSAPYEQHERCVVFIILLFSFLISRFRFPSGLVSNDRLLNFLGDDYNRDLTSTFIPITPAPRGCEILPAAEGSGGKGSGIRP